MYCPRCGEENDEGDRFCSSCGTELPHPGRLPSERRSLRDRVEAIVGTTPRARWLTGGTAIAIAVAVVSFLALDPVGDDDVPRDAYTIAADTACVKGKREIAVAGKRLASDAGPPNVERYGAALLVATAEWRSTARSLEPPADRRARAQELDGALHDVAVDAAGLAQAARAGDQERIDTRVARIDEASGRVEQEIEALDLDECAGLRLMPGGLAGR